MKYFFYLLLCLSMSSLCLSCGSNENEQEKRVEVAQIVANRDAATLMNDLYIGADGNIDALARILQVTPSTIERVRKGETVPTPAFEERLKDVTIYYSVHDKSFSQLRAALDSEYGWYDSVICTPPR